MIFEEFQYRTRGRGRKCYDSMFCGERPHSSRIVYDSYKISKANTMHGRFDGPMLASVTHASQLAEVSIVSCIDFRCFSKRNNYFIIDFVRFDH